MNGSLDYKIGNIEARLEDNDRAHTEIKNYLFNIQNTIDRVETVINTSNIDMANMKGKATVWGTVAGFLSATIVTVIGWFFLRR